MYTKINEFCKIRNKSGDHAQGIEETERFKFLKELCDANGLKYEVDAFENPRHKPEEVLTLDNFDNETEYNKYLEYLSKTVTKGKNLYFNLYLKGTSNKMFIAHHDIVNPNLDNANDDSASCINCLMIKKLHPEVNIVITSGEEPPSMGVGSERLAQKIKEGYFGNIEWVLNLELTGKGGDQFIIGNYKGNLYNKILSTFPQAKVINTPFNDSVILREYGIDSVVITTLPLVDGRHDFELLYNCHNAKDNLASISTDDMKIFVETIIPKLL